MYAVTAATHDGVFHADDVFAGAVLKMTRPGSEIVRTRDAATIAAADVAFDVGGGEFDHHQPEGNGVRSNGIPYAAFGLIWRVYAWDAIGEVIGHAAEPNLYAAVAAEVDRVLVQQIDAADNGVSLSTGQAFEGVNSIGMGTLIGWMRPTDVELERGRHYDQAYSEALEIAGTILRRVILHVVETVETRAELERAIATRYGGKVVRFNRYVNGWQDALRERTDALYAVYPSAGTWRVQAVPARAGANDLRKPLPAAWAGLNGPELATLTRVTDATFAHRGRFIAGATSVEGAVTLATLAVEAE